MASRLLLLDDNGMPTATIQPDPNNDEGRALAEEIVASVTTLLDPDIDGMDNVPAAIMHHLALAGPQGANALPAAMAAIHYLAIALQAFAEEIRRLSPAETIDGA